MNQIIVSGIIKSINKDLKEFTLSVPRTYPSYEGLYLDDLIKCKHINNINKNTI